MAKKIDLKSAEAAAVYDRQIRLWGMETQKRISEARILFVGFSGSSSEVCKNLVLGGVGAVTVMEDRAVTKADLKANFFVTADDVGKNIAEAVLPRLQDLNPYVELKAAASKPQQLTAEAVKGFTIVCAASSSTTELARLNNVCRASCVPFIGVGSVGCSAFAFADFLKHKYTESTKNADGEKTQEREQDFLPLEESIGQPWSELPINPHRLFFALKVRHEEPEGDVEVCCSKLEQVVKDLEAAEGTANSKKRKRRSKVPRDVSPTYMREVCEKAGTEICAVCAIMGGILAQQIIRAVSMKDAPLCNWLFFDDTIGGSSTMVVPQSLQA